jgi:hypothetical protein
MQHNGKKELAHEAIIATLKDLVSQIKEMDLIEGPEDKKRFTCETLINLLGRIALKPEHRDTVLAELEELAPGLHWEDLNQLIALFQAENEAKEKEDDKKFIRYLKDLIDNIKEPDGSPGDRTILENCKTLIDILGQIKLIPEHRDWVLDELKKLQPNPFWADLYGEALNHIIAKLQAEQEAEKEEKTEKKTTEG